LVPILSFLGCPVLAKALATDVLDSLRPAASELLSPAKGTPPAKNGIQGSGPGVIQTQPSFAPPPGSIRPSIHQIKSPTTSTAIFIENLGQFDPQVLYRVQIGSQSAWLTKDGITFDATRPVENKAPEGPLDLDSAARAFKKSNSRASVFERFVFAEDLVNAECCSKVDAKEPLPGAYNYFLSRDPAKWRTNVRGYSAVVYHDVWPDIDLRVYGRGSDLEQEFIVRPGGDLSRIQVSYRGIDKVVVEPDGTLEVVTAFGKLHETKPSIYQEIGGKQIAVDGHFKLTSETSYAFEVGPYQSEYALVVDPTLLYSTFLGGSAGSGSGDNVQEAPNGIAVDSSGNAYVAGYTRSTDFPTTLGAFQANSDSSLYQSSFVTKLNATGSALVYSTYLNALSVTAIAVDASGIAYVTGSGAGSWFPTTPNAYYPTNSSQHCASGDTFVTAIAPTGDHLVYSTCLGVGGHTPSAIAVDSHGSVAIAGSTGSGFPITSNAYQTSYPGLASATIAEFDTTKSGASSLKYSTFLGSAIYSGASGVALDTSGMIYVAGSTTDGFPVTAGAFQTSLLTSTCQYRDVAGNCYLWGGFVAKLDPSSSGPQSLIYSTYLAGQGNPTFVGSIAVDSSGSAYVTGQTTSVGFPVTPGAFQTTPPNGRVASFVTKLNAGGSNLIYSTYLETANTDIHASSGDVGAINIAVDSRGNAYVIGTTTTAFFPVTTDAFQSSCGLHCNRAFLTELNADGSALVYSSYLGGNSVWGDQATSVAVDQTGDAYVTGYTSSPDFPISSFAFQPLLNPNPVTCGLGSIGCSAHGLDAFVTKFPLGGTFRAFQVTPTSGGNAGRVTVTVYGSGLHSGVSVVLRSGGYLDINANLVAIGAFGRSVNATFDLHGAPLGARDLVVANTDGATVTLPQAFAVTGGGSPDLLVDIIIPNRILTYLSTDFHVTISNRGSVDAVGVPFWLVGIPSSWNLLLLSPVVAPPINGTPINWDQVPTIVDTNQNYVLGGPYSPLGKVVPLILPVVPANSSISIHFLVGPNGYGAAVNLQAGVGRPLYRSPLPPDAKACLSATWEFILQGVGLIPGGGCSLKFIQYIDGRWLDIIDAVHASSPSDAVLSAVQLVYAATRDTLETAECTAEVSTGPAQYLLHILDYFKTAAAGCNAVDICAGSPGFCYRAIVSTFLLYSVSSFDPNDIAGPAGVGVSHYVSTKQTMSYSIYFENKASATASAHNVTITQSLDPAANLDSARIGSILIGNTQVPLTPSINAVVGITTAQTTLDLRPGKNVLVNVGVKLDIVNRLITWTFTSTDPATGLPTTDPDAGFLPPGAEGSVSYTTMLSQSATTGAEVKAQASITFDANASINTPVWINTIDNSAPASHIVPLSAIQSALSFNVRWTGLDAGSGIQDYTIFVSDNGSPFVPWQTQTAFTGATYTGVASHTYSFYCIARDLVGNAEAPKILGDTSTQIVLTGPAKLVASQTLSRDSQNRAVANVTLANTGGVTAQNVVVTVGKIGTTSASGLPMAKVNIPAGSSVPISLVFPASVGAKGANTTLTLGGSYTGGSFNFASRITLP